MIEMRVLETNQEFKFLEECIESINTRLIALVSLDGLELEHARVFVSSSSSFHSWLIVIVNLWISFSLFTFDLSSYSYDEVKKHKS